jgi:hypothetical protein
MTDQEHVSALTALKNELFCNRAIYHERVTLLIEFIEFEINDTRVNFKAKIIKPLNQAHAQQNNLYKHMLTKDCIKFSSKYNWPGNSDMGILKGSKLGRPYCPFTLWLDPSLTEFVSTNEDMVIKKISAKILWSQDWQVLIQ